MTQPKRQPRWCKRFLTELAATSHVAASARKARVSTSRVYELRRSDPDFARAWQEALCEGYDALELSLLERMRTGEAADKGAPGDEKRRRYENGTALRLLAFHRDSVKRERGQKGMADEKAILASIRAKIALVQAREAAFADMLAEEDASRELLSPSGEGSGVGKRL